MEEVPGFTRSLAAGSVRHWSTLGLFAVCAFVIVHWIVLKDTAMLNANMVPAPALCASQDDMYDTATRLCRLGNKYAFWYLKHKDWVQCAPNLPGFSMLRSGVDDSGNFWYKFQNSREIRNFYDTCIPECATDEVLSMHACWCASACVRVHQARMLMRITIPNTRVMQDTFHSSKDLCLVTDQVLLSFLAGDAGGTCAKNTLGETAIRTATQSVAGARQYWYAPDASIKVRKLLESCHAQCASDDVPLPQDDTHCQVMNIVGIEFLISKGTSRNLRCDERMPGRRYISHMGTTSRTKAAFQYPKVFGAAVEQFYLSCYKGYGDKSKTVTRGIPHSAETVKGRSLGADARRQRRAKDRKLWEEAAEIDQY